MPFATVDDPKSDTGYWHDLFANVDYRSEGFTINLSDGLWHVRRNGNHCNAFPEKESAERNARYNAGMRKYDRGEIDDDDALLAKHAERLGLA